MGSIVLYIIEWAFALLVLLAIYKAAFSGTTLHRFNRFYLLGATLLSALLPLVHVTITDSTPVAAGLSIEETYFARELSGTFTFAPEPETMWADAPDLATPSPEPERKTSLWAVMLIGTYSIYVLTLIIGWTRGIIRARRFTVWLVTHSEQYGPFSWMNYIVISDSENGFARRASLRHEYSHVKLLHSIDLVVLLACTIVNPVCWLVLQEIKIVHEYEADDEVINRYGIQEQDYQRLLLIKAVGAEAYALASSFNLNIKKRIIMMNKKKTLKRRLIWLLLLIPMLGMTSVLFAHTEKSIGPDNQIQSIVHAVETPNADNELQLVVKPQTVKAGDVIKGMVIDAQSGDPITMANVSEMNDKDQILAHGITDINGAFSMRIINPDDYLKISHEGYNEVRRPASNGNVSLTRANTYDYNEITIFIQTQGLSAMIVKFRHDETGDDECIVDLPRRPVEIDELEDFLDTPVFVKEDIQQVILMVWPDAPRETLSEVQRVLQNKHLRNVRYRNPSPLYDHYSTSTEESNWIGVEVLSTASEQYVVECFGGDFKDAERVENLEKAVRDLFTGKRRYFVIPYSEDNYKKLRKTITKYPDKKVNWSL